MPVDRWGDQPVPVRHQGDTLGYPVLKEVLGFEKPLKRVKDVRVTRRRTTPQTQKRVRPRRGAITVQRDTAPRDPQRDPER